MELPMMENAAIMSMMGARMPGRRSLRRNGKGMAGQSSMDVTMSSIHIMYMRYTICEITDEREAWGQSCAWLSLTEGEWLSLMAFR
jgi:hypothetical protein